MPAPPGAADKPFTQADNDQYEELGKTSVPKTVSSLPRKIFEESAVMTARATHGMLGLLPECYWCAAAKAERQSTYESYIRRRVQLDLADDCAAFPNPYERARLAFESLGDNASEHERALWREASRRPAATKESQVVQCRAAQLQRWARLPADFVGLEKRLHLLDAALAAIPTCCHAVDPQSACPECTEPLDADPGACARAAAHVHVAVADSRFCVLCGAVGHDTRACRDSRLYGPRHCERVTVYYRACTSPTCGYRAAFDGRESGVFNCTNQTLYCEEVPRDFFLSCFDMRHHTMSAYWRDRHRKYEFTSSQPFVRREQFIRAAQAYSKLFDFDPTTAFECPICKHLPDDKKCVIIDGCCMGFPKNKRKMWISPSTEGTVEDMWVHACHALGDVCVCVCGGGDAMMP